MREAIFGVLAHHRTHSCDLLGAHVLDLFAGSGGLGIEALSRSASHAHFVERDRNAIRALRQNLADLGLGEKSTVWPMGARSALERIARTGARFDLVLADPPYADIHSTKDLLSRLEETQMLLPGGLLVLERSAGGADLSLAGMAAPMVRRWGDTEALFFRHD